MNNKFRKSERLCSNTDIEALFRHRNGFVEYPLSLRWMYAPNDICCKVLLSVSKRNFKRAVDRNRIKRLLREGFRLNKHPLYDALNNRHHSVIVSINYIDKSMSDFTSITTAMKKLLLRMEKEITKQ